VDRAFINVELAFACRELKRKEDFERARKKAHDLAEGFEDPGLQQWFQSRYARVA
jgi:hypothetical protein